jgi:hypothetical protein
LKSVRYPIAHRMPMRVYMYVISNTPLDSTLTVVGVLSTVLTAYLLTAVSVPGTAVRKTESNRQSCRQSPRVQPFSHRPSHRTACVHVSYRSRTRYSSYSTYIRIPHSRARAPQVLPLAACSSSSTHAPKSSTGSSPPTWSPTSLCSRTRPGVG